MSECIRTNSLNTLFLEGGGKTVHMTDRLAIEETTARTPLSSSDRSSAPPPTLHPETARLENGETMQGSAPS